MEGITELRSISGVGSSFVIIQFDLSRKVNEALEGKTQKVVYIKADTDVDYGTVMGVMDQLRTAAIEDVGLIVDKPKGAAGAGGQ